MSGIDDLRQTGSKDSSPLRVEIGGQEKDTKRHTVVPNTTRERYAQQPVQHQQVQTQPNTTRVKADLEAMDLPKDQLQTLDEETTRESIVKDILEGEDSILGKYIKEKEQEAKDWMASKEIEDEMEKASEEEELEKNGTAQDEDGETYSLGNDSNYFAQDSDNSFTAPDTTGIKITEDDLSTLQSIEEEDDEFDLDQEEEVEEETVPAEKVKEKEEEEDTSVSIDEDELELETKEIKSTLPLEVQEEEEESDKDTDEEESINHLRELAIERLKPISKRLDISSFTVAKKPARNLNNLLGNTIVQAAKWVLPDQECIVLMREFLGSELETMRSNSEDNRNLSMLFRKYRAIYDHIVSKKPDTYEAWLKATPFSDLDHYMFAVYISSFKGANYLPADCQEKNCGESFLTDDIPILDMVKFRTEEDKKKFIKIYQGENQVNGKGLYVSEIIPLSEKVAIGFKEPSIYGYFELMSLDERFRSKYSSIVDLIPYIDSLYIIDGTSLIPVGYKIYADNVNKTIRSKIATFARVLNTLTVDEFTPVRSYIAEIMNRNNMMSYIYPSVNCPKCGKPTREIAATAEELVFIRYQLGALVNTSLK